MQIKLTRNEFKKALENNDQYEYPLNNETINQLCSVFSVPQVEYVYLSFQEYQSILPIIPHGTSMYAHT